MKDYRRELPEDAKKFNEDLRQMLERERPMPQDTLFSDDYFEDTMEMIQGRNEAFIIQTILHLMFPHVQEKAVRGEKGYEYFVQSFNEGWNSCKKLTQTRPQPDSAIGLGEVAFSQEQLEKLQPHLGDSDAKSDFKATFYMYFPFLTLEVKSGNIGLDVADKQNAHSAGVAGLGLGGLFKITGKEPEVHGKISTISMSFDHRGARIYGYFPIFEGQKIEIYRKDLAAFDYRTGAGRAKWKCLQYALNTVEFLGHSLRKRICSAIDDWIPNPELGALGRSGTPSSRSGLSQIFSNQDLADEDESASVPSENTKLQQVTPESSTQPASPKRKKGKRT
jgi:hypothetical protein